MDVVLTVYLDQMKWIDLARAQVGHPKGEPFVRHLREFERLVGEGRLRLPLSAAHYYETGKQRDERRRQQLTATMMHLSQSLRIAPPHIIVPWEARRALAAILNLPLSVHNIPLFGEGAAHAHASPSLRYDAPAEYRGTPLPEDVRAALERRARPLFEEALLSASAPAGLPDELRVVLGEFKSLTDDKFVKGQNDVAAELQKLGRHRLDDVMLGTAVADIMTPLLEAASSMNVSLIEDVIDAGRMKELVEHMPSRWVEMKLRRVRQANPQKRWHGNDLNDVTALAIAIPYCDVVVTERSWAAMVSDAKVPRRFDTLVTNSMDDVIESLLDQR